MINRLKPLSALRYIVNNKKRSVSMIMAIAVSVLLILIFQIVFYGVTESAKMATIGRFERLSILGPGDKGVISDKVITQFYDSPLIEKIISTESATTDYYHFFGNLNIPVYSLTRDDLQYVLKALDMKLKDGRLPDTDKQEIIVDEKLLNNKGKKLGDYIGKEVDKGERLDGKYKIVGVVEGNCIIGLSAIGYKQEIQSSINLLFPKGGRLNELNQQLEEIAPADAQFNSLNKTLEWLSEDVELSEDATTLILIVIMIIMSFAAGNSSYAQYFSRRFEFSTLQSLGYTRLKILLRAACEILFTNTLGFVFGLILTVLSALCLKMLIYDPNGYPFILVNWVGVIKAAIIPLCTIVFSLIPAWWTLSKNDQIETMEKYE